MLASLVGYSLGFKESSKRPPWENESFPGYPTHEHPHSKLDPKAHALSAVVDHQSPKETLDSIAEQQKSSGEFSPKYYYRKSLFDMLPTKNVDIVFLGDSITEAAEWSEIFPNETIVNRGIGGDTTRGILLRLNSILAAHPQKLFLMIGINDLYYGNSPRTTVEHYEEIIQAIRTGSPETAIYIQSTLPVNNQDFDDIPVNTKDIDLINKGLRKIADQYHATYIDLASLLKDENNQLDLEYTNDGIHLTGKGYRIWANAITPYVDPKNHYSSI
jgi:lysophospholipase L1-like esterase